MASRKPVPGPLSRQSACSSALTAPFSQTASRQNIIITNCAACAAPLAHDAPRCVRCKTRYCDSTCQHDHWRRGHKQICKNIHRGGNAEQYNADKRYKEAVKVAVEACTEDTKGQKCYICPEAVHPRTGEGLVRGCACGDRDDVSSPELGVVHVSCLARQAQVVVEESEMNSGHVNYTRWDTCSLCEQQYHGVVQRALGWACWKAYNSRPERDVTYFVAMRQLANCLQPIDSVRVQEECIAKWATSVRPCFKNRSGLILQRPWSTR